MIDLRKMGNRLSYTTILVYAVFLLGGCEPLPKMISYGSNEYSQLEFEGTSFQHNPLISNYRDIWAGENFSIALYLSQTEYNGNNGNLLDPGMYCKGDSSLGQCDLPDSLFEILSDLTNYSDLKLGFNHGLLNYSLSEPNDMGQPSIAPTSGKHLVAWGDNSFGQTTVPELAEYSSVYMTAVGGNHNVIYFYDGEFFRIISWGDNSFGQCDVPSRFNSISDSLNILSIDAGARHTIVTYDSSGTLKMAAWGDNSYGQLNIPSHEQLNGNLSLLEVRSGYYHNVAIFYDQSVDYTADLSNGVIVDTLFILTPNDNLDSLNSSYSPVVIHTWGDNTYGQQEIPSLDGLLESWDVGGYHNSLGIGRDWIIGMVSITTNPMTGEAEEITIGSSSGREIVSWGRNDFDQTVFPVQYRIEYEPLGDNGPGSSGIWQNTPPNIALGGNHTLISSSNIYRSPFFDYNLPEQFQGSLGDTVYQTVTLKNIGPDTVFIDSIYLTPYNNGEPYPNEMHPIYFTEIDEEHILFGDSISIDLYSIFDELHPINTNAFLTIRSDAWWSNDTTIIPLSSFFGPVIRLSTLEYLTGSSGEIVSQPLTIYNEGTQTVYLDSFSIPAPFSYEPFEENHIDSGDSLVIDLITVLEDFPYWNQESGILSLSNFNTINYGINLISMRYFELGDQIYNGWSGILNRNNPNCNVTSSTWNFSDPVGMFNNLNFYSIEQFYTNVHHFDFGFSNSENLEMYAQQLDSLYLNFRDNSRFVSLIGMDTDQHSALTWPSNSFEDCNSLNMQFDDEDSPVFFQDIFSEHLFPDWVESVIIDQQGVITYIDTFNLETLKTAIEEEIGECGYDCLPDNAINLPSDTIEFSIQLGGVATDTLLLENITDHTIGYTLESQSGTSIAKSIIFNSDLDRLNAPGNNNILMNLNAPLTLSFWFKTIGSNWSTDGVPTTFIAPSEIQTDFDPTNYWRIILTNDENGFPKIGWIDEDSYFLAATPIYEGDWFHFALVIDEMSQNLGIYINGNLEVDEALLNDIPTISNLRINEDSQNLFSGFLSQTASWNTALSASEISYIKDMGPDAELRSNNGDYESSNYLSFYWMMDAGFGSVVEDVSGNNLDATKYGYADNWLTEIVQTGISWLTILGAESGTLAPNDSRPIFFYASGNELDIGSYTGHFNLYPDHNEYVVENTVVMLNVVEELSTSVQNIPNKYALHQNYPNPFNPITKINYNLPNTVKVKVDIYDIRGRKVKSLLNQLQDPGFKSIQWDALNDLGERVSSGMYFYRIETSEFKQTKKMILLK